MIILDSVHSSWKPFLTEEIIQEIREIEREIGDNYNPINPDNILRFLSVDLHKVKVVWLGQDVYPMKGAATGRSFEVGGLESWVGPFRQVSLKNIIRLLHKNYHNIHHYDEIKSYEEIKKEIKAGTFPIKPPHQWFDYLEEQGVLFLNTSFTCEIGKPNSHKKIWEHFSKQVLTYISKENPQIKWFLWGKEAISNKEYIQQGEFFESRHPMMCSVKYEDDFLKFKGFEQSKDYIKWI
ncbi:MULTISPECIES: uracil-DNA glycosylase [Bacillus]|uniref:uracil-DNA glycosylase n=1 Tax=Bacillus TaxID=1386 RepID=UPI0002DA4DCD|nr:MULTISPECIES: uracil-DNA glycosylase [Bacillus]